MIDFLQGFFITEAQVKENCVCLFIIVVPKC